jgi:hypothetical protein
MGENRNVYSISVGKPERKEYLEYQGVNGMIILKWIL